MNVRVWKDAFVGIASGATITVLPHRSCALARGRRSWPRPLHRPMGGRGAGQRAQRRRAGEPADSIY